jgi:hypothetical protein
MPFTRTYSGRKSTRNYALKLRRKFISIDISSNADVLPPGHGRVVEVDVVELLPVGRDVLFDFCDGIATQNLRTPACRKPHPVSREKSGTPVVLRKT